MSITITTDVFCDGCLAWTFGTVGPKAGHRAARCNAKKTGWIRQLRDGEMIDMCPHCKDKEQEKANA